MRLLIIFLSILVFAANLQAQSPKLIETELVKSFKKIADLNEQSYKGGKNFAWEDSLPKANNVFAKKLQRYASRFPETIAYPFLALKKARLDISTSDDGLFRIYSWNTQTGGTMYFFENVFQYKIGEKAFSIIDTPKIEGEAGVNYYKLYTFKVRGRNYYLSLFMGIESSRYHFEGINIFSIEKGKLNDDVKLIKTKTGLHSQLSYEYDFGSVIDRKVKPEIYFDASTKTINLPLVDGSGKVTHKYITYKFTGQYFEKVKN